jgi:hypothetical protein
MVIKINLKEIKPTKDLLVCSYICTVISRAKAYLNQNQTDVLVMFSLLNKDWNRVLDNTQLAKKIIQKIIEQKRLTLEEKEYLVFAKKAIYLSSKKVDGIYLKKLEEYKQIIPKLEKVLSKTFTNTKADIYTFFMYQPVVKSLKGTSLKNLIVFSVENNHTLENLDLRHILTHEIIHSVCSNNDNYQKLYKKHKQSRIFNETFTETITNVCLYKLKVTKKKYATYRFEGRIYDEKACKLEDKIRKKYDAWEKSKSKECFVEYLNKYF